jgi:flagellar protein FliO/FliZ
MPLPFLHLQRSRHSPFARLAQGALQVALVLALTSAWAEGGATEVPGVAVGTVLQTVLGLLLILALLFLAAYGLRRLNGGQGLGGGGPLKIVGGLIMGTRERIVLIEVGDTWLVIGVAPGQIRTLHRMPKGEVPQPSLGEKHFGHWLKQMIERKNEGQ